MRRPLVASLASLASLAALGSPLVAEAANDAAFVSQSVPGTVVQGSQFPVDVTMQNTGTTTWSLANGYFLGSQKPQDNVTWGTNRFFMPPGDSVPPGGTYTFHNMLTAPGQPGDYDFQWQVLEDAVEWFGQMSSPLVVHVAATAPLACDGTEIVCLTLKDAGAIQATSGVIGGDVNGDGFMPADQGGIDWHFGPSVDLSRGRMEVDVLGLLPQSDPSQPEQVSVFEIAGDAPHDAQVLGLQRMMLGYHGDNIFRCYATTDFAQYGWQMGIWTDGFEATGWTVAQTHHFAAEWDETSLSLAIDGGSWSGSGTFPFDAPDKTFTLANRVAHYATQQAVARFSNFRLWALGPGQPPPDAGASSSSGSGGSSSGSSGGSTSSSASGGGGGKGGAGGGGTTTGGAGGSAGSGGAGGAGGLSPASEDGCGCRTESRSSGGVPAVFALACVALLGGARRRRRRSARDLLAEPPVMAPPRGAGGRRRSA